MYYMLIISHNADEFSKVCRPALVNMCPAQVQLGSGHNCLLPFATFCHSPENQVWDVFNTVGGQILYCILEGYGPWGGELGQILSEYQ